MNTEQYWVSGLAPLAEKYQELGADKHGMQYVAASSENMPFAHGSFDVVCSFNSLDHVERLEIAILEITRVLKPGGLFLLLTDVNHKATAYEPQEFSWNVVERFEPAFELIAQRRYEKEAGCMYESIRQGKVYDINDYSPRYGILSVQLRKRVAIEK